MQSRSFQQKSVGSNDETNDDEKIEIKFWATKFKIKYIYNFYYHYLSNRYDNDDEMIIKQEYNFLFKKITT